MYDGLGTLFLHGTIKADSRKKVTAMKKILFWILGIIGVLVIAGGGYAYYMYSSVSGTLNKVYSPLERDHSVKRPTDVELGKLSPFPSYCSVLMSAAQIKGVRIR